MNTNIKVQSLIKDGARQCCRCSANVVVVLSIESTVLCLACVEYLALSMKWTIKAEKERIISNPEMSLCSSCEKPYAHIRAPKAGQRNYCPGCRAAGVPVKIAQRNRRERLRSAAISSASTMAQLHKSG